MVRFFGGMRFDSNASTSNEWKKSNVATPSSFIPLPGSPTVTNTLTVGGASLAHNDIIWVTVNYGGGCSVTDSLTLSVLAQSPAMSPFNGTHRSWSL